MQQQSKVEPKLARAITAQFYVAKGLQKNPAQVIKFIRNNSEYFPHANTEWIRQIMLETRVTEEDIELAPVIIFADLHAEQNHDNELKAQANKVKILRAVEVKKRDFGHGIRSTKESNVPSNVYGETEMPEISQFAKLQVSKDKY